MKLGRLGSSAYSSLKGMRPIRALRSFIRRQRSPSIAPLLAHPLIGSVPTPALASQKAIDNPARLHRAERLALAFARAEREENETPLRRAQDDLWSDSVARALAEPIDLLRRADTRGLSEFLLHFGEEYTWFGGLSLALDGFGRSRDSSQLAILYWEKLVCLAEAIGVLPVENPEQGFGYGRNLHHRVDDVVTLVENDIGVSLLPPPGAVAVQGLETTRGPLHYRHINALYAALRIRELAPAGAAIAEYGGGLGLVGYYAHVLGFSDFTLFDLPLSNVFAGHFLLNTVGDKAVSLYGEPTRPSSIRVLPYWCCLTEAPDRFFMTLNQDSFPEIDEALTRTYLREIERTTSHYFLSINQEAKARMTSTRNQLSVAELVREYSRYRRLHRSKYWIREGYVEELYSIGS